jgi:hypothetical protein
MADHVAGGRNFRAVVGRDAERRDLEVDWTNQFQPELTDKLYVCTVWPIQCFLYTFRKKWDKMKIFTQKTA